jgi:hypothetical protein
VQGQPDQTGNDYYQVGLDGPVNSCVWQVDVSMECLLMSVDQATDEYMSTAENAGVQKGTE